MTQITGPHDGVGAPRAEPVALPDVSRRSFLKMLATVMAATALESSTPATRTGPTVSFAGLPGLQPGTAALPGAAVALLQTALAELRAEGFPFDIGQASVVSIANQPHMLGVTLQDTLSAPRQSGADIALTINLKQPERSVLYYTVGRSEGDGLEVATTMLGVGGARSQQRTNHQRGNTTLLAGAAMCLSDHLAIHGQSHAHDHAPADAHAHTHAHDALHVRHEDHARLIPLGQPQQVAGGATWHEASSWYYDHCAELIWRKRTASASQEDFELAYAACREYRNERMCGPGASVEARGWSSATRRVSLGEQQS